MRALGALLGLAVGLGTATASATPVVRRALVIAHNGSDDPALQPLRFADDDGVMWAETLQRLGVETTLLVDADGPTRASKRPVLEGARTPSPGEVAREVARLRAAHLADREAGRQTDVLLVYVGHGNTDEAGRAYFTLAGGRLDQASLYAEVVDALGADFVHIIVDACRASGVVGRRGQADAVVMAELRGMLAREQLLARPHVGALFAESEDGETHEWSRIRAGVFSHVARSGLLGGADVNGDGLVEYSELGAFVTASLQGVKGLPARLLVYTSAPVREPRRTLVGPVPRGPSLVVPARSEHTRLSIQDDEGRMLADVRRVEGQVLELNLPLRDAYWVRTPTSEARLELAQLGTEELPLQQRELGVRGPIDYALQRGLFAVPLDRAFYEQYVVATGLTPVDFSRERPRVRRPTLPGPWERSGWDMGVGVYRAPLGEALFSTGLHVGWRSAAPRSYGLRASYALTPFSNNDTRLHRLALQAVGGVQSAEVPLFVEAAVGWALVGVTYPEGALGDPLVLAGHVALGLPLATPVGRFRLGGLVGADLVAVDGVRVWDLTWGLEVSLRY